MAVYRDSVKRLDRTVRRRLETGVSALALCLCAAPALAEVPKVATDIAPVHSLVAQIMGDLGTPDLLLPPGASPHSYALKPSDAQALENADLVVWIGPGLTPWLEDGVEALAEGASIATLLELDGLSSYERRESAAFESHDHDHGDEHGHDDEHAHDDEHDHDEEHAHDDEHDDHDEEHAHDDDHDHDEEHAHDDEHDHDEEHAHDDEHDHDEEHAREDDHDHAEEHAHEDEHDHDEEHAHDDEHDHDEEHAHDDEHDHDEEHAHDDEHDHDEHAHGASDPHIWLDPENAKKIVAHVRDELSALAPEHADAFAANAEATLARLDSLVADVSGELADLGDIDLIVFHDAYRYFEEAFGVEAVGAISVSEATPPSAGRLAELKELVADLPVPCMAAEPQYSPGIINAVSEGTGAQTIVMDPLGASLEPGPDLYGGVLRGLAESLKECVSPS